MNFSTPLFSVEEALQQLGQCRDKGCLLIFSAQESYHLFVKEGFIVHALGREVKGEDALKKACAVTGASYVWLPGETSPTEEMHLPVIAHALQHSISKDENRAKTSKVPLSLGNEPKKTRHCYELISHTDPDCRLRISRTGVLGRDTTCEMVVPHPQVSRRHCLLDVTARGLVISDLDSTNGTFINGICLYEPGYVNPGDRIGLGSFELLVQKDHPAPASET